MRREGMTVREAAEEWVREFNAIPQSMIDKLMKLDFEDWHEVTTPSYGCRVYVPSSILPDSYNGEEDEGEVISYDEESELYCIELDDGFKVSLEEGDFEVVRDDSLPMWGTMWSFGDSADDYWLSDMDGIGVMSRCGFRIYES